MALLYMNGFDHYIDSGSSLFLPFEAGDWISGGQADPYVEQTPSIGGFAFSCAYATSIGSASNRCGALYALPKSFESGDTIGIGFMMYATAYPEYEESGAIVGLSGGGLETFSCVTLTPSGAIQLKSQPNDWIGDGTSSNTVPLNTRVHIEVQWELHGSNGSITVRGNGVEWIKATGINTLRAGSDITHLGFFARQVNAWGDTERQCFLDHMFIYDKSGSEHNDWFGPRLVTTLGPAEDVTLPSSWTVTGGSDATDVLGHFPFSPTTHYIESDDGADSVKVLLEEFGVMADVDAVAPILGAYKDGVSPNNIRAGVENGDGQLYGDPVALAEAATFSQSILPEAPGGAPWTPEKLSGLTLVVGG